MTTTCIFHVPGRLTPDHLRYSAESLNQQEFHWERFILFNHSEYRNVEIMKHIDFSNFDEIAVYNVPSDLPPTTTADWYEQMKNIGGTDRYLSLKADFYLMRGACEAIDAMTETSWFLLFNKFDMKENATIHDIRSYAKKTWEQNLGRSDTGTYEKHLGKLAIPNAGGADGIMHAYTDDVRKFYTPADTEIATKWGVSYSISALAEHVPFIFGTKFFALHMWHDVPEKADAAKTIPGERF